jgi:hypothetical protein
VPPIDLLGVQSGVPRARHAAMAMAVTAPFVVVFIKLSFNYYLRLRN